MSIPAVTLTRRVTTHVTGNRSEFTPLIMGEICAPELGTINRAAGNHYSGNGEVYPVHAVYFYFAHPTIRPSLTHPKSKMFSSSESRTTRPRHPTYFSIL